MSVRIVTNGQCGVPWLGWEQTCAPATFWALAGAHATRLQGARSQLEPETETETEVKPTARDDRSLAIELEARRRDNAN